MTSLLASLIWPDFDWPEVCTQAEHEGDDQPVWAYAWPAGQRLVSDLPTLVDCQGKRVVDLGCGHGHLGLTALLSDASEVLFTDASPHPLAYVRAVLTANQLTARTAVHHWGDPLPDGPWDLILGGDILYRPECLPDLVTTLVSSLSPGGLALCNDPRPHLDEHLFEPMTAEHGLHASCERRPGYTLYRITRTG